jgi:hypothetical protein
VITGVPRGADMRRAAPHLSASALSSQGVIGVQAFRGARRSSWGGCEAVPMVLHHRTDAYSTDSCHSIHVKPATVRAQRRWVAYF